MSWQLSCHDMFKIVTYWIIDFSSTTWSFTTFRSWALNTLVKQTPYSRIIIEWTNTTIDQSHRYGRHQAACHEPGESYDKTTRPAICFEHKTQYLLIRAPYMRIVVFWHISNIPPMISQSQISCNTHTFYIAAIFVKYCYTTGNWLL